MPALGGPMITITPDLERRLQVTMICLALCTKLMLLWAHSLAYLVCFLLMLLCVGGAHAHMHRL